MKINPVKAFSDNYIWVIEEGKDAVIVDPGEYKDVLHYLKENQMTLKAIILTHNHEDHIGGVKAISEKFPDTPVYGPEETAFLADHVVKDGDSFDLLGKKFQVFKTAGHTTEHVSFLMEKALFCGDALFSAGCGRVFTGDYQAQFNALQMFKSLDEAVEVYAGHEYTQTNLRFAQSIEPANKNISQVLDQVTNLRAHNLPSLPSTIGKEKNINLFLQANKLQDFIALRNARDNF
ncbi:hydroxyacylglutathione hydrolase [Carnobacterium jeotgali]|uniref:hydroxyacylglutathione hydrolase n=1 Tax=Carnobacterium jeotgali TaxID=545534 RepID=UPI00388E7343